MGTDIHIVAQYRDEKGAWHTNGDTIFTNVWYDSNYIGDYKPFLEPKNIEPDPGRNYALFWILTGGSVRYLYENNYKAFNEWEWAPVNLDDLAYDILYGPDGDMKGDIYGERTATLQALMNHDWRYRKSWNDEEDAVYYTALGYLGLKREGKAPNVWFTTAPEGKIRIIDEADFDVNNPDHWKENVYVASYAYPMIDPRESEDDTCEVDFFVNTLMEELKQLIPEGGTAADVRIVYGFDN